MSKFNPDFWEVVIGRQALESFANEDALWHEYNRGQPERERRAHRTRAVFGRIDDLIRAELTARQRQVVRLYYFGGRSQQAIARELDIPQQVVSQHLFGIVRNGKRVGGAIPKLRKLCRERGIEW